MNRWKASAIHLSICVFVAAVVLSATLLIWYPQPYFQALGGKKLLLVLIGVDVVLGPLLTLIVYRPFKKGLKFDLSVIAILQITALVYGVSVLFQARPVYVVFSIDRFELITANSIVSDSLENARIEEFKSLPLTGPQIVGSEMPDDPKEREHILFTALNSGLDLPSYPQYYVRYEDQKRLVLEKLRSLEDLLKLRPDSGSKLNAWKESLEVQLDNFGFLPIRTPREHDLTAIVDRSTANIVIVIDVDPWIDG